MKICVTAGASGLDAPMDPRFGRCPFFVVVDLESMSENSITNSNVTASSGAGIQAAQEIAKQGVSALITGNIGPNAMQTLSAAKIDVYQHQGRRKRERCRRKIPARRAHENQRRLRTGSCRTWARVLWAEVEEEAVAVVEALVQEWVAARELEMDPALAEAEVKELEEEVKDDEGLCSYHGRGRHARGHLPALRPGSYLHHGRSG